MSRTAYTTPSFGNPDVAMNWLFGENSASSIRHGPTASAFERNQAIPFDRLGLDLSFNAIPSTGCMTPSLYAGSPPTSDDRIPAFASPRIRPDVGLNSLNQSIQTSWNKMLGQRVLAPVNANLKRLPSLQLPISFPGALGQYQPAPSSMIPSSMGGFSNLTTPSHSPVALQSLKQIPLPINRPFTPTYRWRTEAQESPTSPFGGPIRQGPPSLPALSDAVHSPLGISGNDTTRAARSNTLPRQKVNAWTPIQPSQAPATNLQPPIGHESPGRKFHPMQAVAQPDPALRSVQPCAPAAPGPQGASFRFSPEYRGMHTESNASAEHLSPDQNCSLWLTNLPAGVTVHELLSNVRGVGRVFRTFINPANNVQHRTAAAKLVFFTPEAARGLRALSFSRGLFIRGHRVNVTLNRIKSGEYAPARAADKLSRVLIITGRTYFVNPAALNDYFKARFIFEVDEVKTLICTEERCVLEFRFGSYQCQSQMGKMALEKDRPDGFEKVEFGEDPCDVGDTMTAYTIAAQRIQGMGM
ncbi:hypothetical protein B0I35DRAFT_74904 [Stachybotrys elegans]|uniref:RRM domain-containing protein n=1 Tax=Stachybotrys elegans TaxID=80388 RepID=A0A8K0WMF3_9HYPO|nr:hypothetical protein B0I35DRAFT_74904 [Stachybotrys elegans]